MAAQYDRATPEEGNVAQRHGLLPLANYDNGRTGLAFPGFVADPLESWGRLLKNGYTSGDTQGVEDAFNVAGAAMMGGLAAPKPASSSLGMFGGRLGAENLAKAGERRPLSAIEMAERLKAEGASREAIYAQTNELLNGSPYAGVHYPKDGKARFEIDDSGFRLTDGNTVGSAVEHPQYLAAYPSHADIPFFRKQGGGGLYNGNGIVVGSDGKTPGSYTLHELQHAIQKDEGFASGTNPLTERFAAAAADTRPKEIRSMAERLREESDAAMRDAERLRSEADNYRSWNPFDKSKDKLAEQSMQALQRARDLRSTEHDLQMKAIAADGKAWNEADGYSRYYRSAGENESRAVQNRMDLTPDQRRARAPWLDYDVPEANQIVRFDNGGVQNSIGSAGGDLKGAALGAIPDTPGIRAYHGTTAKPFDTFSDPPFLTKDPNIAAIYAAGEVEPANYVTFPWQRHARIIPAELRAKNMLEFDHINMPNVAKNLGIADPAVTMTDMIAGANANGYDALAMKINDLGGEQTQYIPTRRGTVYSPTTGDLLYANGGRPGAGLGGLLSNYYGTEPSQPRPWNQLMKPGDA